jgi:EmrB/QacA subfamily drug resistance transporter
MLGNFLAGSAGRIFSISLPTVASALNTDIVGVSWALLSYQLSSIGLALVFGRIGDIYGREKVYGIGYLVFTVSTFLCGLSQNLFQLILFRIVEGVGGAMTQSTGRALASEAMPEDQASKAQGLMTTAFHSGFLLGPSIGGLIIDYVHWRGIFFVLVPIGALGAFLTFWNMGSKKVLTHKPEVDYLGAALLVAAATSMIVLLDRRGRAAMGAELTFLMALLLLASLVGFFVREKRTPSPIVNLSLFKNRLFTFSTISLLIVSITHALTAFVLPFYLQEILHFSPSLMGVLFMSAPIFTVALAPFSGHLADRIGSRIPATSGVLIFGVSVLIGVFLSADSHWTIPALMLALSGLGTGLFNAPNHGAMIGSVPRQHRGFANGALQLGFNLGHLFGISLGSFLMTITFQIQTGHASAAPSTANPEAFVAAFNRTYLISLIFVAIAAVTSAMRGPKEPGPHQPG